MLQKMPHIIGQALKSIRPGAEKTVYHHESFAGVPTTIAMSSSAFEDGGAMPAIYTEDGAKLSPPLEWHDVPAETQALVLIAEDLDSPTPSPLVHAIVLDLSPSDGCLAQGDLASPGGDGRPHRLGHNSFGKAQYLPPDPPPGHGPHRYMFQLYALDAKLKLQAGITRSAAVEAMEGHVIAKGCVTGIYERN